MSDQLLARQVEFALAAFGLDEAFLQRIGERVVASQLGGELEHRHDVIGDIASRLPRLPAKVADQGLETDAETGRIAEDLERARRIEGEQAVDAAIERRPVAFAAAGEALDQHRRLEHAGERERLVIDAIHDGSNAVSIVPPPRHCSPW